MRGKQRGGNCSAQRPRYPTLPRLQAIVIPRVASDPPEVDYEAELAVVIGRECKDVPPERALDYIAGYTIANDVTARRWQGKRGGGQWVRAKSFDTFLPCVARARGWRERGAHALSSRLAVLDRSSCP